MGVEVKITKEGDGVNYPKKGGAYSNLHLIGATSETNLF
jgi:hypothetical protein